MKAALDVHYGRKGATAACVVFENWADAAPVEVHRTTVANPAGYRAGRFYERELPCLLAVLRTAGREFESIVIDGYVHLKPGAGKGLGQHLREALSYPVVVIGVAKNPLKVADRFVPVVRGPEGDPRDARPVPDPDPAQARRPPRPRRLTARYRSGSRRLLRPASGCCSDAPAWPERRPFSRVFRRGG